MSIAQKKLNQMYSPPSFPEERMHDILARIELIIKVLQGVVEAVETGEASLETDGEEHMDRVRNFALALARQRDREAERYIDEESRIP